MTTTIDLADLPGTPTDVAINFYTFANFKRTREVVSDGGTKVQATYRLNTSNPKKPTYVIVTQRVDPKTSVINTTIRLDTYQTVTVDDLPPVVTPISVTMGLENTGALEDTADVLSLIGSVFSLFFKTVDTKVPNVGVLNSLNIGLVSGLYG